MDYTLIQPGLPGLGSEHLNWLQNAPRKAITGLLANLTELSPSFYISGCEVTTAIIGTSVEYTITEGYVCLNGEVLPVAAQVLSRTLLQVIYLVVDETGADLVPAMDQNGVSYEVMRRRVAKMQVSGIYPSEYMAINSPRQEELYLQRLAGRVVMSGAIIPYFGAVTSFNTSGLGTDDMLGWAICNGNNGTPDLRGMALMGATNVPDAGAPTAWPGVTNVTNPGDKVGADSVVLDADQLPEHTHDYQDEVVGGTGSDIQSGASYPRPSITKTTDPNVTANNPVDVRQSSFALVFLMSLV